MYIKKKTEENAPLGLLHSLYDTTCLCVGRCVSMCFQSAMTYRVTLLSNLILVLPVLLIL